MPTIKISKNGIIQTRIPNANILNGKIWINGNKPMVSKTACDTAGINPADVLANPSAYSNDLLLAIGENPGGVLIEWEAEPVRSSRKPLTSRQLWAKAHANEAHAAGFKYRSSDAAWEAGDESAWAEMKEAGL